MRFPEYKTFDLPAIQKKIVEKWNREETFRHSIEDRPDAPSFIFFEGPPSANGIPGIHHVIARSIKDSVCRYKTQRGFKVERRAGWDTHGLPVELSVEKQLGITKEDIGKNISIQEFNAICRKEVLRYTREWEILTEKMAYWVDMSRPYVTYHNSYIETVWYLLKDIYDKGLLYKGYSIQPYSPAAGSSLSSHELNQPGCYKDVKDTTCTVQFEIVKDSSSSFLFEREGERVFFLAWTTTPWTLPSNTALCVGPTISYVKLRTFNPYTGEPISVVMAKDLRETLFQEKDKEIPLESYKPGDKAVPWEQVSNPFAGSRLEGISYRQLIPWVNPGEGAFRVVTGDFVTTEEGTGIVHIAPTFGDDDNKVAKKYNIPALLMRDTNGNLCPMVDKTGKFYRLEDLDPAFVSSRVDANTYGPFAGRYVKN
ncbi:MAG TPA: class I tRNA ligase family protein, partial [Bacteroidales bacterium]|nr:class I tRNA ligase family protein [Bacteroidales bacterium]